MVAARIANLDRGGDGSNQYKSKSRNSDISAISTQKAASMLSVSRDSVFVAKKIMREAPEKIKAFLFAVKLDPQLTVQTPAGFYERLSIAEPQRHSLLVDNRDRHRIGRGSVRAFSGILAGRGSGDHG